MTIRSDNWDYITHHFPYEAEIRSFSGTFSSLQMHRRIGDTFTFPSQALGSRNHQVLLSA